VKVIDLHYLYNVNLILTLARYGRCILYNGNIGGNAMTAATFFSLTNITAMLGWVVLAAGVISRRPFLYEILAGRWWPLGLSAVYTILIVLFFGGADGGFDSLQAVSQLFQSEWLLVAGWVHYLAFDLFMGALVARRFMSAQVSRLWLIPLLPLTFLFGPAGYLASEVALRLARAPDQHTLIA
jgi:Domain of unknown function (DUF4281)